MLKIPCEIYSRCCGYFRPVKQWNKGKQQEFKDRKNYKFKDEGNEHTTRKDDTQTNK
jgi:ribonucleoside-triphosphate reductase